MSELKHVWVHSIIFSVLSIMGTLHLDIEPKDRPFHMEGRDLA